MFNVNHVTISVSNMKKTIEFYHRFGFIDFKNYKDENVEITLLKLNEMVLEIFCYTQYEQLPEHSKDLLKDLKTLGTKHFALGVESVEKAKKYLLENDLIETNIDICKGRLGKKYFFIKDPDGILVEIIENN